MSAIPAYNEKELLLQVTEGNEAAFRQLFTEWHQHLAGYIYRITESKELTEDIVQDVFLKIWMVRETLAEVNDFRSFLLAVSRNQAFDVLKKQLKEKKLRLALEKESIPKPFLPEDNTEFIRNSMIDLAIDSLPPRRKEVYLLSRHNRLTYKEIAKQLGISRESVKTHLKLAAESITSFIRSHIATLLFLATALTKYF